VGARWERQGRLGASNHVSIYQEPCITPSNGGASHLAV
jgi:hypothetical protein